MLLVNTASYCGFTKQYEDLQKLWTNYKDKDLVIIVTDSARVIGIDKVTGEIRWEFLIQGPLWSSPVVVDDVLLQADCSGYLNAYDLVDTAVQPQRIWRFPVGNGCLEATPAVWDGKIIIGNRDGKVIMIAEE